MSRKLLLLAIFSFALGLAGHAQLLTPERVFTRADTLRGSVTPERSWWNLLKYELPALLATAKAPSIPR